MKGKPIFNRKKLKKQIKKVAKNAAAQKKFNELNGQNESVGFIVIDTFPEELQNDLSKLIGTKAQIKVKNPYKLSPNLPDIA